MGRLIVIEGVDGAGKRTTADKLTAAFESRGATVATLAFPRYEVSREAQLIRDALYGKAGPLADDVYGMGALYALDRHGAREDLIAALTTHDVLLLDRYIASNAAYGSARLHQQAPGEFTDWVLAMEIARFELPIPHRHLLLSVPTELAAERSKARATTDPDRPRDNWESDTPLQNRVAAAYTQLARTSWLAPWTTLPGDVHTDVDALAADLLA
ncbi:dTMP kinase [Actinokineospora sp. G85]|uniref:dTMP kinase n=1 Tax=Actinokineospora sp. G85 TaxID=3406626 RepID=UPI003C72B5DC